jgi:tetratricopeptide (TPR) repeat protein
MQTHGMDAAASSNGFVGRAVELRQLHWLMRQAGSGHGRLVLLIGEAGIGKTRLCEEVAAAAAGADMGLAWAACRESAGQPAFAPWRDVCAQLEIDLGERPGDDVAGHARWQRSVDTAEALRRAASARPRIVVIDDVQWADASTLHLLAHLAPVLRTTAAVILATVRSPRSPGGAATDALLAEIERHATVLQLDGLPATELGALVRELTGSDPPAALAEQLHRVTGGNPLYVGEIVHRLHGQGSLDALAGGGHFPVPATVRAALDQQLAELGERERRLVGVAAVIGHEVPVDLLADVTGLDRTAVLTGLDIAASARVVTASAPGRYAFSHPLLRSALREDLGAAERLRLHERIAEALETAAARGHDIDAEVLAFHYLNAGPAGGAGKAVRYAEQAAGRAMTSFAYERAVELHEHALAALQWAPESADRAELFLGLGRARRAAGDGAGARDALLTAADLARRSSRPELLAAAALALSGGGFEVALFDAEQIALLEEALAGLREEPSLRSRLAARLSVALSLSGQEERRIGLSDEAVALAQKSGDDAALASALPARCDAASGPAEVERRIADSGQVIAIARRRQDRETELLGRRLRVVALLEAGDIFGVDAEVAAFSQLADALHQPAYGWYVPLWRGLRAAMRGQMAEQQALAVEAEEMGRRGASVNSDLLVTAQRWFCRLEAGEVDAAVALFEDLGFLDSSWDLGVQVVPTVALHWLAAGRPEEARALLDRSTDELRAAVRDSEWVPMLAQVAEVCAGLGGHDLAPWVYESLRPFAHRWAVEGIGAYAHGSVGRHLGQLAALLGHRERAERHFDAALAANRRAGAPMLVARTLLERGIALNDPPALEEAAGCYAELGIPARVAEVRGLLDRGVTGAAAPAPPGPAAHVFRRDGDTWRIVFGDRSASVRDSKGVRDLARLMAAPGREIPALDLAADGAAPARHAAAGGFDGIEGDLGEVIDARARAAYKARLVELDADLAEADIACDGERSARVAAERDALLQQLAGAYGLAGRPRRTGAPAERARTAVTARIRDAIRRIESVHPELGRHLARSVRTGTLCTYDPELPPRWEV